MKNFYLVMAIGITLVSCGTTDITSNATVKPKITVTTPENHAIITDKSTTIYGTVEPATAKLKIDNVQVELSGGKFAYQKDLAVGNQLVVLNATLGDQWDMKMITIEHMDKNDEKKMLEKKEQDAKAEQEKIKQEEKEKEKANNELIGSLNEDQKRILIESERNLGLTKDDERYIKSLFSKYSEQEQQQGMYNTIVLLGLEMRDRGYLYGSYSKSITDNSGSERLRNDAQIAAKALMSLYNNEHEEKNFNSMADYIAKGHEIVSREERRQFYTINYSHYLNKSTDNGKIVGLSNIEFMSLATTMYPSEPGWNFDK